MLSCGMKLLIFQQRQVIDFLQEIDDDNNKFRFVKDLVSRSGFGDDSSIMDLIKI